MCTALIYICNIDNLPENIILFEGEELKLRTILGVTIEKEDANNLDAITASADAKSEETKEKVNLNVAFFGIKVKEINVDIIENAEVVPLRNINWSKIIYARSASCRNVRNSRRRFKSIQAI